MHATIRPKKVGDGMAFTMNDVGLEFTLELDISGFSEWYGSKLWLKSDRINYEPIYGNCIEWVEVPKLYHFVKRWAEGDFSDTEISFIECELILKYDPKYKETRIVIDIDTDEGKANHYYSFPIEKEGIQGLFEYLEEAVPNRLKREWK